DRLEQLLGPVGAELTLGTFHAICSRILRRDGQAEGISPRFVIYDDEDQLTVIRQTLQELDLDPKQFAPRALQSAISAAKSNLVTPQSYAQQVSSYFEEIVLRVYQRYQQLLTQSKAVDFDDLLMKTVQLFDNHSGILDRYQSRYLHIVVDEFQDTNIAQYRLVKQLAGQHRNLCVVGDPDQSIYSWRFADLRNILSFDRDYPEAKLVLLEQNYRSTRTILDVASDVISANVERKPKNLWTENEVGRPVVIIESYTEEEEAQCVASEIEKLASQNQTSLRDCAVMYRVNAQSRALEETFIRYGVPYKLVGGVRFYQRREVKDIIAYLRIVHNPDDGVSLARVINVPGRGIGQVTLGKLLAGAKSRDVPLYAALKQAAEDKTYSPHAAQSLTAFGALIDGLIASGRRLNPGDLIEEILARTGYREYLLEKEDGEDRWENIIELKSVASDYDEPDPEEALASFLEKVTLVSDIDQLDEKADAVTLTTLHQAKGLEFPVVFITGLEHGLLPHRRSFGDKAEMEEERRLCYVGMTRAEKRLYLLRSYRRRLFGSSTNEPSPFLKDISPQLVTTRGLWEEESSGPPPTAFPPSVTHPSTTPELKAGDWVRHSKFGDGTVVDCLPDRGDRVVTVSFAEAGVKKLLLSLAPLEKIEQAPDFPA
ncbi:MAG: UvrD-helicase domain-containing protein, partial [Dehalococcoidia bacterium]|nr:UvrD-helicase domain-containing protein [Dehalococcoidia bacterium]